MMKPNEIKKELETAMKLGDAPIGKYWGCIISKLTAKETLAYVNQLEAEVERLNNECRETRRDLLNEIIRLEDQLETAKSDAVEEFAKRLKEYFEAQRGHISEHYGLRSYWEDKYFYDYEIEDEIDKFVKEMEGE